MGGYVVKQTLASGQHVMGPGHEAEHPAATPAGRRPWVEQAPFRLSPLHREKGWNSLGANAR